MKKIEINPEKARVKGNILVNFEDVLSKTNFEDFHVKHETKSNLKWKNHDRTWIRLNPKAEKLYMTLTAQPTSIEPTDGISTLAIHLYYINSQNEQIPVSSQTIYIYDGNNLIGNTVSDENGNATYEFHSEIQGVHKLKVSTLHSNGFDAVSQSLNVIVYVTTTLTLTPRRLDVGHGEIIELKAELKDNNGKGVYGKSIRFYEGTRYLDIVKTDNKGIAIKRYVESENRGIETVINVTSGTPVLRKNTQTTITGTLKTIDGTPIPNKTVQLFMGYSGYRRVEAQTNSNGVFTIDYTPEVEDTREYFLVFMSTVNNQSTNEYRDYEPCLYELGSLPINKALPTVTGGNASGIKDSTVSWVCTVPSDYTGNIFVYSVDENGHYTDNTAGDSMLSSTRDFPEVEKTDLGNGLTKVIWHGWVNRVAGNRLKNKVGTFNIRYRLYDDEKYDDTFSSVKTVELRQKAKITLNSPRTLETKETTISGTAYNVLGEPLNGNITIKYAGQTETVEVVDGNFTHQLLPTYRSYNINNNHTTEITAEYTYAASGYWSNLNTTASSYSYNIKNKQNGIFINQSGDLNLSKFRNLITHELTDLYIRANQENSNALLHSIISTLTTGNIRDSFTIHAVFNCIRAPDGTWYLDNGRIQESRISDLKTHIDELLTYDIDGICMDYIRKADSTLNQYTESDITDALTELTDYIKEKTVGRTVMISACVMAEPSSSTTVYGQNYNVFTRKCDYIIPMLYLYDYSSVNTSTPVKSQGYNWQQSVLEQIHEISGKDNVYPCITTYHGDSNTSTHNTVEEYVNQVLSMWGYGVEKKHLQRSIIYFRYGLITDYPPNLSLMSSPLESIDNENESVALRYGGLLNNVTAGGTVTVNRGGDLKLSLKTSWGAKLPNLNNGSDISRISVKVDGVTLTDNDNNVIYFRESEYDNFTLPIPWSWLNNKSSATIQVVCLGNATKRLLTSRLTWTVNINDSN